MAPTAMPSSRRSRGSQTSPSVSDEGRCGRKGKNAEQWNARFKELLTYKSEHGDCDVPTRRGQLGKWMGHQRSAYWAGSLAQDRIDQLSSIGFKWSIDPSDQWNERFEELLNYRLEHGDCNVPRRFRQANWESGLTNSDITTRLVCSRARSHRSAQRHRLQVDAERGGPNSAMGDTIQ